ncbi:L,D-transpeptidase family protein [Silvibacterium dinghuense]|uniref:Murein L,D-transpeptidase n=1 Tax=Silvibacterium dinghuense TaxID=1560006 RepID=A0A4Q1S9T3_9BACT|nr:L,D-transpeptidase family protein [Silvibacterium dinghuense]RXS93826.1 murein L,D-transpeptidase [Silvibacterium dinghuense]GGH08011.1 murein L,D-transpeptidase [Silvibacterium dinghuense]
MSHPSPHPPQRSSRPASSRFYPVLHRTAAVGALSLLILSGCHSQQQAPREKLSLRQLLHRKRDKKFATKPAEGQPLPATLDAGAIAAQLHTIADAGRLSSLRYPDFRDYQQHVERAYGLTNFTPMWLVNGAPSPQALGLIAAIGDIQKKGLDPEEYDASRWPARLAALKAHPTPQAIADFDAAMTVSTMRLISDLHIGRVAPAHFNFGIDIEAKKYDLPELLTTKVIHAASIKDVLEGVEPDFDGYQRTETALVHYEDLAAQGDGAKVPGTARPLSAGDAYTGSAQLADRLHLLGDLPESATAVSPTVYDASLVDAVKHFQARHGIEASGKLGKETVDALNVPLAARVVQLEDALERWRWLPPDFDEPPIVVNIPEFVLRAFGPNDADHAQQVALQMNVVVGKAVRTQTPVFAKSMRYIVFRPYWNVPPSIVHKEIIPSILKNRNYIDQKGFEITDSKGTVVSSGAVSDATLAGLKAGRLMVRQKPGPKNSLGLIKFIFPNEDNVYLHSTPAQQLFGETRRDFSHGCVRVSQPAELAAYLLRNQLQPGQQQNWTLDAVKDAMQSGPDNKTVLLAKPIPVLILYVTAVVEDDNSVHFFADIYGHDKELNDVLAKGTPYPSESIKTVHATTTAAP